MNVKELLKDPGILALFLINNSIAVRDIFIRIFIEFIIFYAVYWLIEQDYLFFAIISYYILAIWHSFWGYAGIGHELMHGKVFSSKIVNKTFYKISSFLVWSNPAFFSVTHLYHHGHTFAPTDSESIGTVNWKSINIIQYLLLDVPLMIRKISYSIINALGKKYNNSCFLPIEKNQSSSARLMLLFNFAIHAAIYFLTNDLLYNTLFFILPFFGQFLNRILAQSQHLGLKKYSSEGPIKHSRSIYLPQVIRFLYANMNYHAEHHLVPSVPYYNLPKLSDYLINTGNHHIVDWKYFFTKEIWFLLKERDQI